MLKKLTKSNLATVCIAFMRQHWKILIIILLGLTPLLWFSSGFIIARGDYLPFLNPLINTRFIYVWSEASPLGSGPQAGNLTPMQSIWIGIWYFLASLGLTTRRHPNSSTSLLFSGVRIVNVFSCLNDL